MYLVGVAFFCLALVPSILSYDDVHNYMSNSEIHQVFQTNLDSVPEHELFGIELPGWSSRKKRELLSPNTRLRIRVCDTDTLLWLSPPESPVIHTDTPVLFASSSLYGEEHIKFQHESGLLDDIGQLMEDPVHLASMIISFDPFGNPEVNGRIEKRGIVIRSVPSHVVREYLGRNGSNIDFDPANSTYHVAYRINDTLTVKDDLFATANQTVFRERLRRSIDMVPETLYMEILLVADNTMTGHCNLYDAGTAEHRRCIKTLLAYFAIFWNGVDLRFRLFEQPELRVSISTIVIAKEYKILPYIADHVFANDPAAIDGQNAMLRSGRFFFNIRDLIPLDTWDVAVTMTRRALDLGRQIYAQAYPNGACSVEKGFVSGVSLVTDDGSLNAVPFAVHELGHTLGMNHDGDKEECSYKEGFAMGPYPIFTKKSSFFSNCSISQFQARIDNQNLMCLYNKPRGKGDIRPLLLPGQVKSRDQQCLANEGGLACDREDVDICVRMTCYINGVCEKVNRAAYDGTPCGDKNDDVPKMCVQSKCVAVNKSPMVRQFSECVSNGRPKVDGVSCGDANDIQVQVCFRGECVPEADYRKQNREDPCLISGVPERDGTPCNISNDNIRGVCHRGRCFSNKRYSYRRH